MAEYVKGVGKAEDESAQAKVESSYMGVDDEEEAPTESAAAPKQEGTGGTKFGAWVSGDGADADKDADMAEAEEDEKDKDEPIIHEKAIGRGELVFLVLSSFVRPTKSWHLQGP